MRGSQRRVSRIDDPSASPYPAGFFGGFGFLGFGGRFGVLSPMCAPPTQA